MAYSKIIDRQKLALGIPQRFPSLSPPKPRVLIVSNTATEAYTNGKHTYQKLEGNCYSEWGIWKASQRPREQQWTVFEDQRRLYQRQ